MATLEQIKLLESRLTRAINFVARLTEENSRLKKRNDELEETNAALREEKTRVEEGIVSALRKLNQFEDAIEKSLSAKSSPKPETLSQARPSVEQGEAAKGNAGSPVSQSKSPAPLLPAAKPAVPSAYTIDEEAAKSENTSELSIDLDLIEDSGEAELDIF